VTAGTSEAISVPFVRIEQIIAGYTNWKWELVCGKRVWWLF